MNRANQTRKDFFTQTEPKRTIFSSILYWNFLRLAISCVYHILIAINAEFSSRIKQVYLLQAGFTFVYVALAYIITADAEIVKMIQGQRSKIEKKTQNDSTYK